MSSHKQSHASVKIEDPCPPCASMHVPGDMATCIWSTEVTVQIGSLPMFCPVSDGCRRFCVGHNSLLPDSSCGVAQGQSHLSWAAQ